MIDKLYQEIAANLKLIKPCAIYQEDVPQDFRTPCFMITFYDQNPSRGINGRLKNSVRVDLLYFPLDETNYQEECWSVGQSLQREFQPAGFKIKNRNMKITDKVMHFLFDVDYREYKESIEIKMTELSSNTNLKEV